MASYDIIGNIAIVKFPEDKKISVSGKKKFASSLLKQHKRIKTVVEKADRIKGRLRTIKPKYLAGEKNLEALYKENKCVFRFNVEKCYFSPRLSEERKKFITKCKKGEEILIMFSGVAPFAIVIAKNNKKIKKITCIELGRECNKYALDNVKRNNLKDKIELIQGDVKRRISGLKGKKFNRIIMARPNLKESFIKYALKASKKSTIIHYYGFSHRDEVNKMKENLLKEVKKEKRKIKILKIERAGDIAPGKFRYRIDIKVLS